MGRIGLPHWPSLCELTHASSCATTNNSDGKESGETVNVITIDAADRETMTEMMSKLGLDESTLLLLWLCELL